MKNLFGLLIALGLLCGIQSASFAQQSLNDVEYAYVTMDLQGILNLTMTTNPQTDFVFKTIQEHKNGITKFNAVQLQVDATVAWDLFAYANEGGTGWTQVDQYSTNGIATIPSEILEIEAVNGLGQTIADAWTVSDSGNATSSLNFQAFTPIKSYTAAGLTNSLTPTAATQFIAGEVGTAARQQMSPGVAFANPSTHQFRLHYKIKPGIPAKFMQALAVAADGGSGRLIVGATGTARADIAALTVNDPTAFAQAGYYYLEVAYVLVEDL
ncbi:MAG: hypothetical protein A2X12_00600 [Bacteroidetes bacterium GWE2_29_8]|nr:MAG: hypothetical protein A2X12_00600 [Bacteroidetes bacterium GWE2_29_8]OFY17437.1 MAG: hypothetical protein A2X02_00895 [Bacteroidetes bacterium GWF2_29_10]